ncbi:tetratricopeptide repeat protein [Engelhardtia mirabilis]|uniref:Tetratricopeptide repeat protein n=1 Tax=Engelhardtia mirabilis TaxID=2528011 RepID=A0A518BMB2_9BACT|nr:Tetratricopeptide repeat protein [Planctomycetes bacterium Pla133]QDV02448.1 Tetratricopeptide repeat protein [Planctomycetes bacterium Pla86]
MRLFLLCSALALAACNSPRFEASAPLYYDVGVVHRTVSTDSPEAQLWFDRGLGLCFGFNHEEALACFRQAVDADPECAMAWWGQAYAQGTNYNSPFMSDEASHAAFDAIARAVELADSATAVERALIDAMSKRFTWPAPQDRAELEAAYAEAMETVHGAYPDDPEVAALTAEALMQLRPWALWSHEGEPAPELARIRPVLEQGLQRWPDHPALCHLYIHAMEAGPEVGRAIPAARSLESLTPGLGHLVHMPSHIYTWTGRYDDVVRVNLRAVEVDDAYADFAGRENLYTAYRIHNYHFVAYGAMWDGRRDLALEYARQLVREIPDSLIEQMPDLFEVFTATPYHVMVRFGLWEELLAEPEPAADRQAARAVWRYARGVALASLGRVEEAQREQLAFRAARAAVPESRFLFQNPVANVLEVADRVLEGEIAYRRGDYDQAFASLRDAVAYDERLNYDEPWGWMEPVRHALGALLTEQGHYVEAEAVYRENLRRYPENGWALHGLAECLRGQGRTAEAARVQERFDAAWKRSDVVIPGSCFCKGLDLAG